MDQEIESPFEQLKKEHIIRRKLLPLWIKVFCWIFMLMGTLAIICLIFGVTGNDVDLSLYGFKTQKPFSAIGLFLIAIMLFKGFTAYSLWFEKNNAIALGKIDAIIGVVICIISMFVLPFIHENWGFSFRLEILLLIPYYMKLDRIEFEWVNREKH